MRQLDRDARGGITYTALAAFGTLICIAVVWNIMSPSITHNVFDWTENQMTEDGTFAEYEQTHIIIVWIWDNWPIILLGAVIIWMYVGARKPQQPQYAPVGYGGGY